MTIETSGGLASPRDQSWIRLDLRRPVAALRGSLAGRIALRLCSGLAVLWAAVTLTFLSIHVAPGEVVDIILGDQIGTPELVAAIEAEWGLDRPLGVQYLEFLGRTLQGDFGRSYMLQTEVSGLIWSQLGPTLRLTGAALAVALIYAVGSALLTAGRPWGRRLAGIFELTMISTPSFWLGIVLLYVFSFTLKIFPVSGDRGWSSLVLPSLAIGLSLGAVVGQVLRQGLERALDEPFALTVRSWGVREIVFRLRHALRHAAIPAVALVGWLIGGLLAGAVVTEQVFGRPGLGRITVDAVLMQDMPVVIAVAMLSAAVYVALSTLVDLACLLIDPRLRAPGR